MVPSDTPFTTALTEPLKAIQALFEQHHQHASSSSPPSFGDAVAQHFQALFESPEALAKVPALSATSLPSLLAEAATPAGQASGKLVRFRCIVQDTSLGNEVVLSSFAPDAGSSSAAPRRNALFGAEQLVGELSPEEANDTSRLTERTVMYAVSVPGQNAWAAAEWEARSGDQDRDAADILASLSLAEAKTSCAAVDVKAPLPERPHVGALLKLYSIEQAEKLQLTQVVDVLGVLDRSALPNEDWNTSGAGEASASAAASTSTSTLVPCLHAILVTPVERQVSSTGDASLSETERAELEGYLSQGLGGDKTAAKWLLMALVARIHTRRSGLPIGSLSLNLSSFPSPPSASSAPLLAALVAELVPNSLLERLALPHLNAATTRMMPSSEGDVGGLKAGRLQLARNTLLLLDEGAMGEGQLKEGGIRNVKALANLLERKKLAYAFPFSEFEMDADLNVVVLSQGKSFLPVDVQVPVEATREEGLFYLEPQQAGAVPPRAPAEKVAKWRRFLARSLEAELTIPDEVSEAIQADFVEARKGKEEGVKAGQEDLLRRMTVARLWALVKGRREMDLECWKEAVELDEERRERVARTPKGVERKAA